MSSKTKETTQESTWSKETGYIWSMIGSAVGFGNVLSFSALCYKNGGGAFLIPYILAHIIIGIPLLFLEGIVGQKTKLPIVSAMGEAAGFKGRMFGWLAVLTCATIGGFYIVLTGFSVAYTYFAAAGSLDVDSSYFFKHIFLQDSGSLTQIGGIAAKVLISTLVVALFAWAVLTRSIRSGVEKLCTIFLPLLALIVMGFSIAALFLPGSIEGFKHYLLPNFSRLNDWTLWRDVFGQVFFSLSLGLGIVTGYSRHNPNNFKIPRAMIKVAMGDFLISFISGFAIFGFIGFLSVKSGMPFESIITSDSAFEIGFVIFPMILGQFGEVAARILGPLFFFCIFIAGITGVFSIVESVAGNIELEFKKSRKWAVAIAMAIVTTLALPFCLGNGQHMIGAIAPMVLGNSMLVGGIAEIVIFLMLSKIINKESIWFYKSQRSFAFRSLMWAVLPLLVVCLLGSVYQEVTNLSLATALRWIWLVLVLAAGFLLSKRPLGQRCPSGAVIP